MYSVDSFELALYGNAIGFCNQMVEKLKTIQFLTYVEAESDSTTGTHVFNLDNIKMTFAATTANKIDLSINGKTASIGNGTSSSNTLAKFTCYITDKNAAFGITETYIESNRKPCNITCFIGNLKDMETEEETKGVVFGGYASGYYSNTSMSPINNAVYIATQDSSKTPLDWYPGNCYKNTGVRMLANYASKTPLAVENDNKIFTDIYMNLCRQGETTYCEFTQIGDQKFIENNCIAMLID